MQVVHCQTTPWTSRPGRHLGSFSRQTVVEHGLVGLAGLLAGAQAQAQTGAEVGAGAAEGGLSSV